MEALNKNEVDYPLQQDHPVTLLANLRQAGTGSTLIWETSVQLSTFNGIAAVAAGAAVDSIGLASGWHIGLKLYRSRLELIQKIVKIYNQQRCNINW